MKKAKADIKYYVNVVLMCLLAFAAGYVTSPPLGKYSSFMLLIPIAAASGFVKANAAAKAVVFAACGYLLNSFYGGGTVRSAVCAVLCALCAAVCHYAAELIAGKKAWSVIAGVLLIMFTAIPHAAALGSPFAASESDAGIFNYISDTYGDEDCTVSGLRYDVLERSFYAEISPRGDVSQKYRVSYEDGSVRDAFRAYVEKSAMAETRAAIVAALRAEYPDGKFEVVSEKTVNVFSGSAGPRNMVFSVYISAYVDYAEFARRAGAYASTVRKAGVDFAYLVFYGGRAGEYFRRITLRGIGGPERGAAEFVDPVPSRRFFNRVFGVRTVAG